MKSATIPSLRVEQDLRDAAASVLDDGESLSSFVEHSIRAQIEHRLAQREFIARGLASRKRAQRSGRYVSSAEVLRDLEKRLTDAKAGRKPR